MDRETGNTDIGRAIAAAIDLAEEETKRETAHRW
jgi:hypothetical protein